MATHSGSLLRKLQAGFAAGATLLALAMAVYMDAALRRSLEAEDAQVLAGQAASLRQRLEGGGPLPDPGGSARPEKVSWRALDAGGRTLGQSALLQGLELPTHLGGPRPLTIPGRGTFTLLVSGWGPEGGAGRLVLVLDRSHEGELIHGFRKTLAAGVAGAGLAAAALAWILARWGLAPLRTLVREAESISDQSLDRRLESGNFPRELSELVATLNGALDRLQEAFEHLGNLGAELAHELRTPLQNLRSTLENRILQSAGASVPAAELGILLEDCDRMAALIEQILFLARSERLDGGIPRVPVPVPGLLEEVRTFFEAAAEEAGVRLEAQAKPGLELQGDRLLLTRALHNLVSNALRHTPPGGWVRLEGRHDGGGTLLAVADSGRGIPEAWVHRLGTPFLRPPGGRADEGHGLGLALVKRIAALLGGQMTVRSREGQGTTVGLRFPGSPGMSA